MPLGYLCLVLHAHLPFVRHPEYDDFLEEDWLYEAITETYIPLLEVFDGLERDGVDWRLTMSVTPTLAAMLSDPLLAVSLRPPPRQSDRAGRQGNRTHALAAGVPPPRPDVPSALHALPARSSSTSTATTCCNGFRRFFETGKLELITCGATHGFLPLMNDQPRTPCAPRSRSAAASSSGTSAGGRRASGCRSAATSPGVDEAAARRRHPLLLHRHARRPVRRAAAASFGVYAPILCPEQRRRRAWPATPNRPSRSGAPSRAIPAITTTASSTATSASISITSTSSRTCTRPASAAILGIKYYKITGRTDHKQPYNPHGGAGEGRRARRQLHVQPRKAGRMAVRLDGRPAAADRRALRRRAVRPLVVRGAGLDQLPAAQDALRPADRQDDHRAGIPRPPPEDSGGAAVVFELGLQGLLRGLAGRLQRLDLSPPARGRRPHGRAGPAASRRRRRCAAGR